MLEADGYLLGTPANLGYMSGALKHFFDQIYYPCLDATVGRPFGVYLHGNNDTAGASKGDRRDHHRASLAAGARPAASIGEPERDDLDACRELGAALAAGLTIDSP